jgi:hypothetical protein
MTHQLLTDIGNVALILTCIIFVAYILFSVKNTLRTQKAVKQLWRIATKHDRDIDQLQYDLNLDYSRYDYDTQPVEARQ